MKRKLILLVLNITIPISIAMQPAHSQASNPPALATSNIQIQQQKSDRQKEEIERLWLKWIGSVIIPALIPLGLFLWLRAATKK